MNFNALKNISLLTINDKENIRSIENICVGLEYENLLETLSSDCVQQIKLNCLNFYKTAIEEMLKRLPYKDPFFQSLMFLDPKIALYNDESRLTIKDLSYIVLKIKNIDMTKLDFEWRILPSVFNDGQKKELASFEIDKMWKNILEFKDFEGVKMFPNLESLVEVVLSLPHSNPEAEGIFSIVTDVKNKKRNRLSNDTVSAICVVRSSFQDENINCTNVKVDSRHLELYAQMCRSQTLDKEQSKSDDA